MTRAACVRARVVSCVPSHSLSLCSISYALSLALLYQPSAISLSPQSLFSSVTYLRFIPPHPYNSSQLYPSADTVVILDATSLRLVRTLAFSQVFPSRDHVSARITSLAVDPALKLVCTSLPIPITNPFTTYPCLASISIPLRWLPHPVRGLPFGPSPKSPPALGLSTHRSLFPMTSTSQLSTVDPVSLPCCYALFIIAHLVQASWPSQHNQRCLYTL